MKIEQINNEILEDAKKISRNYARVVETRQKLFELTNKVKEKKPITPNDFEKLVNQIMELTYVLTDLEIEKVIQDNYEKKILEEYKNKRNNKSSLK